MKERKEMFTHMPKEMRTVENNGARHFVKCEWCGYDCSKYVENESIFLSNEYRYAYDMILCDRCTDKFNSVANGRDVDEYWEERDAKRDKLPPFNYNMPEIDNKRLEEMDIYKKLRWKDRK